MSPSCLGNFQIEQLPMFFQVAQNLVRLYVDAFDVWMNA